MSEQERRQRGRKVKPASSNGEEVKPRPIFSADTILAIPQSQDIRTVITAPDPELLKEEAFHDFTTRASIETATRLYTTQMLGTDTATSIATQIYFCSGVVERDSNPEARAIARRFLATFNRDVIRRGELHRNLLYLNDEVREKELVNADSSIELAEAACSGQPDLALVPAYLKRYYVALQERSPYVSLYANLQGEIEGDQRELLHGRTEAILGMRDRAFQAFPSLSGSYLSAETAVQVYRMPEDMLVALEDVPPGPYNRPEEFMFTQTNLLDNAPRVLQKVADREDRNQRILEYLGRRFLGDSMYLALGEVLYLLPRGHLPSLDGLSPDQQRTALITTDFQCWLTDALLMPGLSNSAPNRKTDRLIQNVMNTLTEQEGILGNIAIQTALFGAQSLRMLKGAAGPLKTGATPEVRKWAKQQLGRPFDSEGEAVQVMTRVISSKLRAIRSNLVHRFGEDNRIRGLTQNALFSELSFAADSPLRLARAVDNSREQETMSSLASSITVPDGSYYSTDVPEEFSAAGVIHLGDSGIRKQETPEVSSRKEQLLQKIRYEKGRAMQYFAHTLFGLIAPDRILAPELALRVGIDGERGYHTIRADGALLRINPANGTVTDIDMIVEDKWGLGRDALWATLMQQHRELTGPEYATARRILVRMKTLDDPAANTSPEGELTLRRISYQDLKNQNRYRVPGEIEEITIEDIITGLQEEDPDLAEAAEAIMHLEKIFQHGSNEAQLESQLTALQGLKTALFAALEQGNELLRHPHRTNHAAADARYSYLRGNLRGIAKKIDVANPARLIAYLKEISTRGNPDNMLLFLLDNKLIRHDLRPHSAEAGRSIVEKGRRAIDTDMTLQTADYLTVVANSEIKVLILLLADQLTREHTQTGNGISRDMFLNRLAEIQGQKRRDDMSYKHAWDYCTRLAEPRYGIFTIDENGLLHLTEKGTAMVGIAGHTLELSSKYGRNFSLTDTLGYANTSGFDVRQEGDVLNTRPVRTLQIMEVVRHYPEGISPDDVLIYLEKYSSEEVLETLEELAQSGALTVDSAGLLRLRARRFVTFVDFISQFNSNDSDSQAAADFAEAGREKADTILNNPELVNKLMWKSLVTSHYSSRYRPLSD